MKWFRTYIDIIDDEKIASISATTFKVFLFLMAFCCQNDHQSGTIPDEKILPWRFRMRENKIKKAIKELELHGMVKCSNGAIIITNWNKRQFKSDDIKIRVDKFRAVTKDKNETLHETLQVTPQNRTDTEQIQNRTDTEREKRPRKVFQKPTIDEIKAYILEKKYTVNPDQFLARYESNGWMVGKNHMKDWRATIRYWQANNFDNGGSKKQSTAWGGIRPNVTDHRTKEQEISDLKYSIGCLEELKLDKTVHPNNFEQLPRLKERLAELEAK